VHLVILIFLLLFLFSLCFMLICIFDASAITFEEEMVKRPGVVFETQLFRIFKLDNVVQVRWKPLS